MKESNKKIEKINKKLSETEEEVEKIWSYIINHPKIFSNQFYLLY